MKQTLSKALRLSVDRDERRGFLSRKAHTITKGKLVPEDGGVIPAGPLAEVFLRAAADMLPPGITARANEPIIENIRGRSADTPHEGSWTPTEELLYVRGEFVKLAPLRSKAKDNGADRDEPAMGEIQFETRLMTTFESFPRGGVIAYRVNELRSPILSRLLPDAPPIFLFRAMPAIIREVRFGLEFFEGKVFDSLLGAAPEVSERFTLEIRADEIVFGVENDSSSKEIKQTEILANHFYASLRAFGLSTGPEQDLAAAQK